jgi:hypothetical protein
VTKRVNDTIDIEFLNDLQALLEKCLDDFLTLSPHWLTLVREDAAVPSTDTEIDWDWACDITAGRETVGEYFDLPNTTEREIWDPRVEALLLQGLGGVQVRGAIRQKGDKDKGLDAKGCCGRCDSGTHSKAHTRCVQFYRKGLLLCDGVCGNCLFAGANGQCSFRRKSSECPSALVLSYLLNLFVNILN